MWKYLMTYPTYPLTLQIVEGMVEGKKEKRQTEETMVWQHQRVDRTELYEGQTQCTRQISVEENDKEVCRRWSPIVRGDGGSEVATFSLPTPLECFKDRGRGWLLVCLAGTLTKCRPIHPTDYNWGKKFWRTTVDFLMVSPLPVSMSIYAMLFSITIQYQWLNTTMLSWYMDLSPILHHALFPTGACFKIPQHAVLLLHKFTQHHRYTREIPDLLYHLM